MSTMLIVIALAIGAVPQHRIFEQPNLRKLNAVASSAAYVSLFSFQPEISGSSDAVLDGGTHVAMTYSSTGDSRFCSGDDDAGYMANNSTPCVLAGYGLLVESNSSNLIKYGRRMTTAAWSTENGGGAGAVTVTAGATSFPGDGSLLVGRFQIPATAVAGGGYADVYQHGSGFGSGAYVLSMYLRGVSADGNADMCWQKASDSSYTCTQCAFFANRWSRCKTAIPDLLANSYLSVGNSSANVGSDRAAIDIYATMAQLEPGTGAPSSFINTGASSTSRSADLVSFAYTPPVYVTGSEAMNVNLRDAVGGNNGLFAETASGSFKQAALHYGSYLLYVAGASALTGTAPGAGAHRLAAYWGAGGVGFVLDGVTTTGAGAAGVATDAVRIGNYDGTAGTVTPGWYSHICLDPSATFCR